MKMAKWEKIVKILQKHLDVSEKNGVFITSFKFSSGRTQSVCFYKYSLPDSTDWLQIASPVGSDLSPEKIESILCSLGDLSCGLVKIGDTYFLRHTTPIEHIVIWDEIKQPMEMVCKTADVIENHFVGGDEF
jgi:hypothetical protein